MKKSITIFLIFFLSITLHANNDRALYIKKYSNETKTALVIGNSNYNNNSLSKLKNPVNDARAVRDKLKEKNFEVLYIEDATQRQMDKIVKKFNQKLKNSGVGLFYFAGHGLEVDKQNYIIPLGADVSDEMDIKYEAIAVNEIVDRMKRSGTRLNIVVLDACRNNPFKRGAGGLAPMQNAKGTLIAYATDSGSTASDNVNEKNGLFTKHFLKALDEPINQREFFHKIRKSVYDASGGRQLPYLNDGTIGDFFFTVSDTIYKKSKVSYLSKTIRDKHDNIYKTIISPHTNRIWLDRNLGAKRVCQSLNDELCYGDYFQWGRNSDGHEKKNSSITVSLSYNGIPNNDKFILSRNHWMKTINIETWNGVNGYSNPCPKNFRIPTMEELLQETLYYNIKGLLYTNINFLKLAASGFKFPNLHMTDSILDGKGSVVGLWSSSIDASNQYKEPYAFVVTVDIISRGGTSASYGIPVRCIKD